MTKGVLGIVICPMLDDNLIYNLRNDGEDKDIFVVSNGSEEPVTRKMEKYGIPFVFLEENGLHEGFSLDRDKFSILIYAIDLGLHSKPEALKEKVEDIVTDIQPLVDAVGFYLGTCGNYEWDIPKWCRERGLKPSAMFCDSEGNLCHDCVGVNIAGGPKYYQLQKKYTGHIYMFPAMAVNKEAFMNADQADTIAATEKLTDEMREVLGIEPGRDGYMRWLLKLGGYEYLLRIDTGLGDPEEFDEAMETVKADWGLETKIAEEGWADLQPTIDIYSKCKSFLSDT